MKCIEASCDAIEILLLGLIPPRALCFCLCWFISWLVVGWLFSGQKSGSSTVSYIIALFDWRSNDAQNVSVDTARRKAEFV